MMFIYYCVNFALYTQGMGWGSHTLIQLQLINLVLKCSIEVISLIQLGKLFHVTNIRSKRVLVRIMSVLASGTEMLFMSNLLVITESAVVVVLGKVISLTGTHVKL